MQCWITNNASSANGLIQVTATNYFQSGNIYCVDITTNGATAPMWAGWAENTPYYIIPQATNNTWVHLYTNYAGALSVTNWIPIVNAGTGTQPLLYCLTNLTSFNADVIPIFTPPTSIRTGVYDVYFRTPAAHALYYVTGNCLQGGTAGTTGYEMSVNLANDNLISTAFVRIASIRNDGTMIASPVNHVLINPQ
jgi:hypothetical protein